MIKNLAIGGVVGLLFMVGGFYVGMRFVHVPVPKPAAVMATTAKAAPVASRDAISVDALRKTSEGMMEVNDALRTREQAVAAREKKAQQREDELDAERAALDRSHERFHELYTQFQQKLQLVNANEADQLQRQLTIYTTMDPAEACDLIRSLDDGTIVRLFSMMDTKPLAALVSAWKGKYPTDSVRLLTALTQMGKVMPDEKVALSDPALTAPATTDAAPTTEAPTNPGTAPEATSAPANVASTDSGSSAPAPDASTPAPTTDSTTPTPDASTPAAPATTPDASTGSDAAAPSATPAPTAPSTDSTPDASAPPAAPATPAAAPATSDAAPAPLAPPPNATATSPSASTTTPNDTTDSVAQLGVPGETAAEAVEAAQRRTGRLSADISNDRAY